MAQDRKVAVVTESQQTDQDAPRLGSNVFQPQDQTQDQGAHGAFAAKAHGKDPVSWASMHRASWSPARPDSLRSPARRGSWPGGSAGEEQP